MVRKSRKLENYKKVSSYIITSCDLNPQGILFGGVIASEIDKFASSIAKEYSNSNTVTASLYISFYNPAYIGEELLFKGRLAYVGNTSIGVLVDVEAKNYKTGDKRMVASSYIVLVAKGERNFIIWGKP
jgi:acyl-CoA hydrolase